MRYLYTGKTVRILRKGEFVGYLTDGTEFSILGKVLRFHVNGSVQSVPLSESALNRLRQSKLISLKPTQFKVEKGAADLVPAFLARDDGKFPIAGFTRLFTQGCLIVQEVLKSKGITVSKWVNADNVSLASRRMLCKYEGQQFYVAFNMGLSSASVGLAVYLPFDGKWSEFERSIRPAILSALGNTLRSFGHYHTPAYVNKSRVSVRGMRATLYKYVAYLEDAEQ